MTCANCNRLLVERTIATKTKKIHGDVIVLTSRQALVCDEHGVVAWDPVKQHVTPLPIPYIPYVPAPWPRPIPVVPYNPQPWTPPWITRPYCGGTTTSPGVSYNNAIQGTARRQLSSAQ